jgi:ABC-type transport system involved in multi-copper enzyme maturation permease subunit
MAHTHRPGGLTALAILNFIFGVITFFGLFTYVALVATPRSPAIREEFMKNQPPKERARFEALLREADEMGGLLWASFGLDALGAGLAIASGFGYLKMRKRLGRGAGTLYGMVAIASAAILAREADPPLGGFTLETVMNVLYPGAALILINTLFARDFDDHPEEDSDELAPPTLPSAEAADALRAAAPPPSHGGVNLRHLALMSLNFNHSALRSGTGVVFLLFALFFGLAIAHATMAPIELGESFLKEQGLAMSREEMVNEIVGNIRKMIQPLLPGGRPDESLSATENATRRKNAERWMAYLVDENPAMLSAIFAGMLFGLPLIIATGAFNLFSGDIQHRGLRYLLLRTERANIYFGRFIGISLFSAAIMALLTLTIGVYLRAKLGIYEPDAIFRWSLRGFLALAILTLPYAAFCAAVSGSIDSPFASLTICSLAISFIPVGALVGATYWEPLRLLNYLLPWWTHAYFMHPDVSVVLGATAAGLAYTAFYLGVGYWNFARRDL